MAAQFAVSFLQRLCVQKAISDQMYRRSAKVYVYGLIASVLWYFATFALEHNDVHLEYDSGGTCSLTIQTDLPGRHDPLLLVKNSQGVGLIYPTSVNRFGKIILQANEKLLVACPGKENQNNEVIVNREEVAVGTCNNKNELQVENTAISPEVLKCKYPINSELSITNQKCANQKGTLIQLGYTVGNHWFRIIDVCHNTQLSSTYYSTHSLYGSSLQGAIISSDRIPMKVGTNMLYKDFSPDSAYSKKNVKLLLNAELGNGEGDKYYAKTFISRGHLSPDGDFIFAHEQLLTYFYVNMAPQWQSINGGYWARVEKNVRKLAIKLNTTLTVTTGTNGIMKLPDKHGKLHKVYLEPTMSRLPVPDLYWKSVVNEDDKSCIVIISTNNPFIESAPKSICKDITKTSGWPVLKSSLSKGYVYYCDYNEFQEAVPDVPDYDCQSVLKWTTRSSNRASNRGNRNRMISASTSLLSNIIKNIFHH